MERKVSADYLVDSLMDKFVNKKIKPGDRIIETKLAEKMNLSQTVVREAINILMVKGFLEREPYRGTKVKNFTIKEIIDYRTVRAKLETISIDLSNIESFYENINLDYLHKLIDNMLICSKIKDYKGRTNNDIKFHEHIVKAGGNKSLFTAWQSLGHYYWAYALLYLDFWDVYLRTIIHNNIYEALKKRKSKKELVLIMEKHFSDFMKLLSTLSQTYSKS